MAGGEWHGGGGPVVRRRGRDFHVRRIPAAAAQKTYTCPACSLQITPGTAHVVVWPADSLFGEAHAAGERRHWHTHCWRIG
ncbi:MAG TPA: hypothetical protein H9871_01205 [Candidatus Nesterenkonia stercoripullorum]|uniref:ATP/GTP-binding protein n=1 Tax=Candidatus Nesterenkonia stercoripullorum TaxID=2838701 RepID=A0A9D1UR33_9MICC|nr:hypothetical protein [Candidatus Nesterenkonia stercoripullorum]